MRSAILDISVAIPKHFVRHEKLAEARGVDPKKYTHGLGCKEMSVCAPGEDSVTLAAEAAWRMLTQHPEKRENIELCIVATESAVDAAMPTAIHVHKLLDLPSSCRVFDLKHACYSGTAALQMAIHSTQTVEKYALVITTDIARYERFSSGEPTQGAGAIAMLIGISQPGHALLEISSVSGLHATHVYDFWRPNHQSTAFVKGKLSIDSYLNGLAAAYHDYSSKVSLSSSPKYLLFHVPFPAMAKKAHRRLLSEQKIDDEETVFLDYQRTVQQSLWVNERVGNIYTGSLYLALAGLYEREYEKCFGQYVGIFSYGSGSCSEFYTGRFGKINYTPHIAKLLRHRKEVDVQTYENMSDATLSMEKNKSFSSNHLNENKPFSFLGIHNNERIYKRLLVDELNNIDSATHPHVASPSSLLSMKDTYAENTSNDLAKSHNL